jgi:hypothetical protein
MSLPSRADPLRLPSHYHGGGDPARRRVASCNSLVEGAFRVKRLQPGIRRTLFPGASTHRAPGGLPPAAPQVGRSRLELARSYQDLLDRRVVDKRTGLARYPGVSRARVAHALNRLRTPVAGGKR